MTVKEFEDGWKHFCRCINFEYAALDARAIRFMNEMPSQVREALLMFNTRKKSEEGSQRK